MAVLTQRGDLRDLPSDRLVGGGPCAIVRRGARIHGTCILQKVATALTPLDAGATHRLVLVDGRSAEVRILKHSLTACGPEIVRFEGVDTL